jgi:CheY-specific phosphatase CheX
MTELELQLAASERIAHLDAAVAEVFELMLGMACLPVESEARFATRFMVTINLSGPIEGTCWLCLGYPAAQAVVEAMLGGSHEGSDSMIEDAARELCNMIVGSWKSKLPPSQASARLSLPVSSYGEAAGPGQKRLYSFDGNLLALVLSIRESEQNYLTTDWKSGELSSDAN